MTCAELSAVVGDLMSQGQNWPTIENLTEMDLWPYRKRTTALLRRYGRMSIEIGRLPSLSGREIFRARLTSYSMKNFEDVVVFIADMEHALAELSSFDRELLAMKVLEDYTIDDLSKLMQQSRRTVQRSVQYAIDELSRTLLANRLLEWVG